MRKREKVSESRNIRSLDYDHRFISSVDALFRTDYTNLSLEVVHISIGESSEIHFSLLVGDGDPVNRRMSKGSLRRVWCDLLLRKMVQLQQNVMNMAFRKTWIKAHQNVRLYLDVFYVGERIDGILYH